MKLNIYTDETFTQVKEVRSCDKVKIPYRVGQYVVNLLANADFGDDQDILKKVLSSEEQITKIVCATFGLKEEELELIDVVELTETAQQIVAFVVEKLSDMGVQIGESKSPNR